MADDELRQTADMRLGRILRGKYRLDRVLVDVARPSGSLRWVPRSSGACRDTTLPAEADRPVRPRAV